MSEALHQVYASGSPEELAAAYSNWSSDYDRETVALGYCLPFVIGSWVARYVPRDSGPILDAGCGTGLSGPYLRALGYDDLEGLDFSPDMIAIAATRHAYRHLTQAELGKLLPWSDGHFAAFFATGVFTEGHAPASSLTELARITRAGGHAVFTIRNSILETAGFRNRMDHLTAGGIWRPIEESPAFRAFAIGEPDVLVTAFVFEVL